jgi:hypothetical protein
MQGNKGNVLDLHLATVVGRQPFIDFCQLCTGRTRARTRVSLHTPRSVMAKLRPALQAMEVELGYTVSTLAGVVDGECHGCRYSDLSPVCDCLYDRTERE